MDPAGLIALLTDFGAQDHYVGVMKGVILRINPRARIVDISHGVPSRAIPRGAFLLSNAYAYFPDGTIFVAVVDPGVGTDRAILAVRTDRQVFVAPDNGILGFLEEEHRIERAVRVTNSKYFLQPVSRTFHGRDIFAPVAAHLSLGVNLRALGDRIDRMARIPSPVPRIPRQGVIVGEVVSIDRFGNLVTNIPGGGLAGSDAVEIRIGRHVIPHLSESYAQGRRGGLLALIGSTGNLEISVNQGSARRKAAAKIGDVVRVRDTPKRR